MAETSTEDAPVVKRGDTVRGNVVKREARPKTLFDVVMLFQAAAKSGILAHEINNGAPCLTCGDKCAGFELHFWRKRCVNCMCGPTSHRINDDHVAVAFGQLPQQTLGSGAPRRRKFAWSQLKHTVLGSAISRQGLLKPPLPPKPQFGKELAPGSTPESDPDSITFAWEPAGLEAHQVLAFFSMYPGEQVPIIGRMGEQTFRMHVARQMPLHDFDPDKCHDLSADEREEFETMRLLKESAHTVGIALWMDHAAVCSGCGEAVDKDTVAVRLDILKPQLFHPQCLTCTTCHEICVGMNAFMHKEKVYCSRHFNDIFRARCAACDESIMEDSFVKAEGQSWHCKHFCCHKCDDHLAGQRYMPIDDKPHCVGCYNKMTPNDQQSIELPDVTTTSSGSDGPASQIYEVKSSSIVPRAILPAPRRPPKSTTGNPDTRLSTARRSRSSKSMVPPADPAPRRDASGPAVAAAATSTTPSTSTPLRRKPQSFKDHSTAPVRKPQSFKDHGAAPVRKPQSFRAHATTAPVPGGPPVIPKGDGTSMADVNVKVHVADKDTYEVLWPADEPSGRRGNK